MKFAHKFLAVISFILVLTLGVNIFSLKFFSTLYFDDYLENIQEENPDIDFDVLSAFLSNETLDDQTIREYVTILNDLSSLSRSLESFSENPKIIDPPLLESLQRIGVAPNTIERYLSINAVSSFVDNLTSLGVLTGDSAESIFVRRILQSMLAVNVIFFAVIVSLSYVWVRWSFHPIRFVIQNLADITKNQRYARIEYAGHDEFRALVDAINELNQSLSRQEKIRSEFLADLSHEIKTPASAVKCALEGIEDGVIAPDRENLSRLREDIDRLVETTLSIMEYERLENEGANSVRPTIIDARTLARRTAEGYRMALEWSRQRIEVEGGGTFEIRFDEDRWVSILHNVYSNFAKYAGENTTLIVSFERGEHEDRVIFADDGAGVDSDEVAYLREKFYQVEKSRSKTNGGGIGIGLSIVDRVVLLHGGTLSIQSAPREGFRLALSLPRRGFTHFSHTALDTRTFAGSVRSEYL